MDEIEIKEVVNLLISILLVIAIYWSSRKGIRDKKNEASDLQDAMHWMDKLDDKDDEH